MGINSFSPANNMGAAIPKTTRVLGPVGLGPGLTIAITNNDIWVTQATFYGYAAIGVNAVPTPNSVPIAVGVAGPPARVVDIVPAGGSLVYQVPAGTRFNLKNLVASGAGGTSVVVTYVQ